MVIPAQSTLMNRIFLLAGWLACYLNGFTQDHLVRETGPLSPEDELAALRHIPQEVEHRQVPREPPAPCVPPFGPIGRVRH